MRFKNAIFSRNQKRHIYCRLESIDISIKLLQNSVGLKYVLKYENINSGSISNPDVRSLGFIRLELVFREY